MRKIVIGFDASEEARDALALADRISRLEGAELFVAIAGLFEPQTSDRVMAEDSHAHLKRLFAAVGEELGERRYEPLILEGLPVARALALHAEREGVDLIVLGSTHRGRLGQVLPGSVGEQLLHGSPCPVAIAPRGFKSASREAFGLIGVAYDGGPEAELALREAERLARLLEVGMRLIAVAPAGDESARHRLGAALERGAAAVPADLAVETVRLEGDPARVLTDCCGQVDLLVMGSRGRGPLRRTLLGGVSAHVFSNAPCPVVVVPRGAEGALPPEPAQAGAVR